MVLDVMVDVVAAAPVVVSEEAAVAVDAAIDAAAVVMVDASVAVMLEACAAWIDDCAVVADCMLALMLTLAAELLL